MPFTTGSSADYDVQKTLGSSSMVSKKRNLQTMFMDAWDEIPQQVRTPLGKNKIKGADRLVKQLFKTVEGHNQDSDTKATHAILMVKSKKLHVALLKAKAPSKKNCIGLLQWGGADEETTGTEQEQSAPTGNPRKLLEAWLANPTPESRGRLMDFVQSSSALGILNRIKNAARKNRSHSGARALHDACELRMRKLEGAQEDAGSDAASVPGFPAYDAWAGAGEGERRPTASALLQAINTHTDAGQLKALAAAIKTHRDRPAWVKLHKACKARFAALKEESGGDNPREQKLAEIQSGLQTPMDNIAAQHNEFNKLFAGLRSHPDPLGQALAQVISSEMTKIFVPLRAALMEVKTATPETAAGAAKLASGRIDGVVGWMNDNNRGRALQSSGQGLGASFNLKALLSELRAIKRDLVQFLAIPAA